MPYQSEYDSSQTHIAILADTELLAVRYGTNKRRHSGISIIALWRRAELYLLYGKSCIPLDVVPGTSVQPWHGEIVQHVIYGRLVPIRDLRISSTKEQ